MYLKDFMTVHRENLELVHNCHPTLDIVMIKDRTDDDAVVLDKESWDDLKDFIKEKA